MKTIIALSLVLLLGLSSSGEAQHDPDRAPAEARAVTPSLDLDSILRGPGQRWSIHRIAKQAVAASPTVEVARERLAQAEAITSEAQAGLLPRVLLTGRYTRLSRINNDPLASVGGEELRIEVPRNHYVFRAIAAYPISQLFLEILPGIRAAKQGEAAGRYEVNVTRNAIALRAISIYMNHARARGALAVAELAMRQADENLRQAEARLRNGLGNRPDVLRFKGRVAQADRGRAESQALVESSANALRALLNLQGAGPFAFEERLTEIPDRAPYAQGEALLATAWAERDEMLAVNHLVRSRAYSTKATRGSAAPKFAVEAGVSYANPNARFVPPVADFRTSWNVSTVVFWSPDGAYAASQAARRAAAATEEAWQQREELRDLIRIEVVQADAEYRAAFVSMEAAQRQVDAAEEAYAAKRRGYELGAFDATEVIDAEVDANRARLALIDVAANLRIRENRLRRAAGQHLWE